eukprot:594466-Hanusia_phi.AAC.2
MATARQLGCLPALPAPSGGFFLLLKLLRFLLLLFQLFDLQADDSFDLCRKSPVRRSNARASNLEAARNHFLNAETFNCAIVSR